jgi:hypothetical protein
MVAVAFMVLTDAICCVNDYVSDCLHNIEVAHEREKGMRPDWPPIYTILMIASIAPQPP